MKKSLVELHATVSNTKQQQHHHPVPFPPIPDSLSLLVLNSNDTTDRHVLSIRRTEQYL